jgi:NADPH2:quinone reductase
LARTLIDLTVIATASRAGDHSLGQGNGAHHVIDHRQPMATQVAALGLGVPAFVLSTNQTDRHASEIAEPIGFWCKLF